MKKILSLLLVLTLCVAFATTAFAASPEAVAAADRLNGLGLFNGVGDNADGTPNYDLDRAPNRMEAVTLLVRLLGKEADAQAGTWKTPFTDVADWAKPYVGYAYENGLTSGTSATTFSGTGTVSATQYLTFVLRALGYSSDSDFAWNAAWELTDELGITNGEYDADSAFTRGDAVLVSVAALDVELKDGSKTLLEAIEENLANAPVVPALKSKSFMEVGKTYDYHTLCYVDPSIATVGKMTMSNYRVITSDATYAAKAGYEWRIVCFNFVYDDVNAYDYGTMSRTTDYDYYTGETFEFYTDTDIDPESNKDFFDIEFNGKTATCRDSYILLDRDWYDDVYVWSFEYAIQVPVGYDGFVSAIRSAAHESDHENGSDTVDSAAVLSDPQTLYFRYA